MDKRGQFFLIAALVIVLLIAGFYTLYNYASPTSEDSAVFALSKEINFEASQVLDSGVLSGLSMPQVAARIQNLTQHYSKTNPNIDFIVIFGNQTRMNVTDYKGFDKTDFSANSTFLPNNTLEIHLAQNQAYKFKLREGYSLFIILKKESPNHEVITAIPQTSPKIE